MACRRTLSTACVQKNSLNCLQSNRQYTAILGTEKKVLIYVVKVQSDEFAHEIAKASYTPIA